MKNTRSRAALTILALWPAPAVLWLAGTTFSCVRPLDPLPQIGGSVRQRIAEDWGRIVDERTHCVLVNNVWNKTAAGKGFEQDVFLAEAEGGTILGWRWRAPWQAFPNVISQPQLVCGDKPWDEPRHLLDGFPFRAGSKRLTVDLDVRLRATGTYNMAFTMWAVSGLPAARENISHEIMIWNANGGQSPAGKPSGVLDVDHTRYDLFVEQKHGDASRTSARVWTYVAFVARTPVLSGRLDLTAFVDELLARGLLSRDHFLTSLELGNEVCQGSGIAEIHRFALSFR